MRYLVTGGAGFIGSHLVDRLQSEGHNVCVLDDFSTGKRENLSASVDLFEGCITDEAMLRRAMQGCEGVFHLAAIASVTRSVEEWLHTHKVNQMGAVAVFEAAAELAIPVVYASSAAVYGDNSNLPLNESAVTEPLSPYGLDKLACEMQARIGFLAKGLRSVGLRFFNVYGPRQDPKSPYSGVISIFVNRLQQRLPIVIYGDGEQTRDFIYVSDIVEVLMRSMQQLEQGQHEALVLNACTEKQLSVNELARVLSHISDMEATIEHKEAREGDIRHSLGDAASLKAQLGRFTMTPLQEGLAALWKDVS